ncbi:hypothetical protein [Arthrobacter crystallopoietes]|uniref:Lipoprotein n=1 Tax=Crystallibacter crystallopoietes TaxID=37928 RepID=A0A1H1GSB6_9MICC|nr:hypothetical protein [Arthrobacter crystallopoietes]SDR16041.1 hypothetical protein SAMN04489742_4279 [Arthrobacter crystallopoietes]
MTRRWTLFASAAILLLGLTACVGGESTDSVSFQERDPNAWAQEVFGSDLWQAEGMSGGAGGIAPGSEAGTSFTPEQPGWYSISIACQGPTSISVKITGTGGEIGSGITPCGPAVTTTMDLPVGKIAVKVDGANTKGMWALAVSPTEAP